MPDNHRERIMSSKANLLGPNTFSLLGIQSSSDIQILTDWHRPGAETYVTDFLLTKDGATQHLIGKACIKYNPRETMQMWLGRRHWLEDNGVNLPRLYLVDSATIVEEYIDYGFAQAYKNANSNQQANLKHSFIDTYKRIVGAGFSPASLHDVRSRGSDTVMIDVGEDLGAPTHIDSCRLSVLVDAEKSFRQVIG